MAKGILTGIAAMLLLGFVLWLGIAYTGAYNVAAIPPHADVVRWTLETTMHNSVASRADELDIELSERVAPDAIAAGARHYAESCAQCHGAPGVDPADWAAGMRPEPPLLVEAASEWSAGEIYWIVENGIRMSGMPAFGPHHDEQDLIDIAAFVSRLPGLSGDDYASLTSPPARGQDRE